MTQSALFSTVILTCIFTQSVDETATTPYLSTTDYQSQLMHKCIRPYTCRGNAYSERLWQWLGPDLEQRSDPCMWRGVRCALNVIQSFTLFAFDDPRDESPRTWIIDIEYFPNTLEYVHLENVRLSSEWRVDRLPREMRYFHSNGNVIFLNEEFDDRMELCRLPRKMEELLLPGGWGPKHVVVSDAPATLRFCMIQTYSLESAVVDHTSLPEALKVLILLGGNGKCDTRFVVGKAKEKRVIKKYMHPMFVSERYRQFDKTSKSERLEFERIFMHGGEACAFTYEESRD